MEENDCEAIMSAAGGQGGAVSLLMGRVSDSGEIVVGGPSVKR